jgi:hypothetical protein
VNRTCRGENVDSADKTTTIRFQEIGHRRSGGRFPHQHGGGRHTAGVRGHRLWLSSSVVIVVALLVLANAVNLQREH